LPGSPAGCRWAPSGPADDVACASCARSGRTPSTTWPRGSGPACRWPRRWRAWPSGGPEALRGAFSRFANDYHATGRFGTALDRLKDELADPTADRVIEALRLAREVGGSELGRMLRTLSGFLRDEQRVRKELEARQTWVVVAARMAFATPWAVLLLLATKPEAVAAYRGGGGAVVLAVGAAMAVAGYRLMLAIGRLPAEERVLR
jgi:tight adherence protein B